MQTDQFVVNNYEFYEPLYDYTAKNSLITKYDNPYKLKNKQLSYIGSRGQYSDLSERSRAPSYATNAYSAPTARELDAKKEEFFDQSNDQWPKDQRSKDQNSEKQTKKDRRSKDQRSKDQRSKDQRSKDQRSKETKYILISLDDLKLFFFFVIIVYVIYLGHNILTELQKLQEILRAVRPPA